MLFIRSSASTLRACNAGAHLRSVPNTEMQSRFPRTMTAVIDSSFGRLITCIRINPAPAPLAACRHFYHQPCNNAQSPIQYEPQQRVYWLSRLTNQILIYLFEGVFTHNHHAGWSWVWGPPSTTTTKNLFTHNYSCSCGVDLTSMIIPPVGAIRNLETKDYGFKWKVCRRVLASYKFSPVFWPWNSQRCHIVTTNKIDPTKVNYDNRSQLHLVSLLGKVT